MSLRRITVAAATLLATQAVAQEKSKEERIAESVGLRAKPGEMNQCGKNCWSRSRS
jgi:hypothetical protein